MRVLPAALLIAVASSSAPPLAAQPAVGDLAPEIAVDSPFGYNGPTTLQALRGRAVVMELWATWCGPCIPALEHLASVAAEVEGEPVTFLTVTDETEADVARFLGRRPTPLPVTLDADSSVFQSYRPSARPHTVLIYPDGTVAAHTRPEGVTAEVVRALVAGGPLSGLEVAPTLPIPAADATSGRRLSYNEMTRGDLYALDSLTAYKAVVAPYSGPGGGTIFFYDKAVTPYAYRRVVSHAWPGPLLRWAENAHHIGYENRGALPEENYFVDVIVPSGTRGMPEAKAETVRLIERAFGVQVRRERRTQDVYRLESLEGVPLGLRRNTERGPVNVRGSSVIAVGQPFSILLDFLSNNLGRPVIDMTGLGSGPIALYDFEVEFTHGDEPSLDASLAALGLRVIAEDGRVSEILIVEPADD